jgi:hypothetical protein
MYDVAMRPVLFRPAPSRRSNRRSVRTRPRRGRALVECCVSLVLLAGAGALTLLITANTAHLVDESRQRDLVLQATGARLSRAVAAPCLVTEGETREAVGPRGRLHIISTRGHALHTVEVEGWWQRSGFAGNSWHRFRTTAGGWCE